MADEKKGEDFLFFGEEKAFAEGAMDRDEDVDVVQGVLLDFCGVACVSHGVVAGVEEVEGIVEGPESVRWGG